jgi:hypothetical protein
MDRLSEPFKDLRHQFMKGHDGPGMNGKSVQAEQLLGHFSNSDIRYW